jgi:hypothetical protein
VNPIREQRVLEFVAFLRSNHPNIGRLRDLHKRRLLELANEFERGRLTGNDDLERKWVATFDTLLNRKWDGYAQAREAVKGLESPPDFLERYADVPLHAVFMYTSQDDELSKYIVNDWGALHGLSGDFCDFYPSVRQYVDGAEDAYDLLNEPGHLDGLKNVAPDELPGIYFWDNRGDYIYVPISAPDRVGITAILRALFTRIRQDPSISNVRSFVDTARLRGNQAPTRTSALKVVFFAANPETTTVLALDEEMREITRKLRMSDNRDRVTFIPAWAARTEDLLQHLNQHKPDIVHFSGHGSSAGELVFVGADGAPHYVGEEALRAVFSAFRDNVRVVLMNACHSAEQARAISSEIDFVIGMNAPISDGAATTFASSRRIRAGAASTNAGKWSRFRRRHPAVTGTRRTHRD